MTTEDREFLNKINVYAEEVLKDIDPQNTHVSEQLEKLKPIMEQLSKEMNMLTYQRHFSDWYNCDMTL